MKVIYIDTETTGLEPKEHGIIQIAGFVEIDGQRVEDFNFRCNILPNDVISDKALEINHKTREEIAAFQDPYLTKDLFTAMMKKYVNPYDREDKFIMGGYNVKFDIDFLKAWFAKMGDKYYNSWFDYHAMDVYPIAVCALRNDPKTATLKDYKLVTVAAALGIPVTDAHDAMVDINMTKLVMDKIVCKVAV